MNRGARDAALRALERCEKDGAWSSAALDAAIRSHQLEGRDASLASRLFLGVLQNEAYLDYVIDLFCRGWLEKPLRRILRLGAYQILFLDKVPVHAAVAETVELCRGSRLDRAVPLANAVLRRIASEKAVLPPVPGEGSAAYLATRWSHPLWLAEKLVRERGYAFTEAFFRADNESAPLCIQVNRLRVSPEEYTRSLLRSEIPYRAFPELPGCLELEGGKISLLPGFEEGLFYVQDRAARAAVHAAGVKAGDRVLDACAAPGGKSFAALLDAGGEASLISCDLHEKKLRLVRSGAERLGLGSRIETRARDARLFAPEWERAFDLVLADVPCSGLGVIRRRPEIRRKSPEEIRDLSAIQAEILDTVCRYVKPGGVLLYSTCTILREENQDQIRRFLEVHEDFAAEDFSVGSRASQAGCMEFWPQSDGTDGFFAAKLRRKTSL